MWWHWRKFHSKKHVHIYHGYSLNRQKKLFQRLFNSVVDCSGFLAISHFVCLPTQHTNHRLPLLESHIERPPSYQVYRGLEVILFNYLWLDREKPLTSGFERVLCFTHPAIITTLLCFRFLQISAYFSFTGNQQISKSTFSDSITWL